MLLRRQNIQATLAISMKVHRPNTRGDRFSEITERIELSFRCTVELPMVRTPMTRLQRLFRTRS